MIKEEAQLVQEAKAQKEFWGISTCIDLYDCDPDLIRSEVHIREYVQKLCELIKIKTYGACHVVHYGEDPKVCGFSMFQLIEKSSISAHFVNQSNAAYIDIFSSKPYDESEAALFSQNFFEAKRCKIQKTIRQ